MSTPGRIACSEHSATACAATFTVRKSCSRNKSDRRLICRCDCPAWPFSMLIDGRWVVRARSCPVCHRHRHFRAREAPTRGLRQWRLLQHRTGARGGVWSPSDSLVRCLGRGGSRRRPPEAGPARAGHQHTYGRQVRVAPSRLGPPPPQAELQRRCLSVLQLCQDGSDHRASNASNPLSARHTGMQPSTNAQRTSGDAGLGTGRPSTLHAAASAH